MFGERKAENWIEVFEVLGMLKLDEPKRSQTVEERFEIVVCHLGMRDLDAFCTKLDSFGLKIVEK
jgi:hypothetical protein